MRKKFRFLTVLAVCVMVLSCFSVTAFAYADDTEQNLPVTEATQPEQQPETTPTPEKPKGEPIDDEGNASTRDLLYDKATNNAVWFQIKDAHDVFAAQVWAHCIQFLLLCDLSDSLLEVVIGVRQTVGLALVASSDVGTS